MNNQNNNEPKFWKGDSTKGFSYGAFAGFMIGIFNISSWNIPHLGLFSFIVIWLIVGTNPIFADKRSPEEIERDNIAAEKHKREQQIIKENATAVQNSKMDDKIKKNELKIQKNELKLQKQALKNKTKLKCPKCKSTNVHPLGVHKKGFSVGKAVGGTILVGGVGSLAGFAGKNSKKTDFVCMKCGKQFKK